LPLFPATNTNISPILQSIKDSNLPWKEELLGGLLKFCSDNKLYKPKELVGASTEVSYPIPIKLNEDTYPLLYSYIDTMEQYVLEVSMENKQTEVVEVATEVTETATAPESTTTVEENVVSSETTTVEQPTENTTTEAVSVVEAAKVLAENTSLKEEIASLNEQIDVINEKSMELAQALHISLAQEVAILSKILKRTIAREKTLEAVTSEVAKRTTKSLEDTLSDLLLDFDGSAPINVESVEHIENPVLQSNDQENITKITVDPVTGNRTLDLAVTEEEEEDSIYKLFLGPKKLAEIKGKQLTRGE
jgi:hypothetical protein